MKKLNIKSSNCSLEKVGYGGVHINNRGVGEMIAKSLPEKIKEYKEYPIRFNLSIEFLGDDEIEVATEGYEPPKDNAERATGNE